MISEPQSASVSESASQVDDALASERVALAATALAQLSAPAPTETRDDSVDDSYFAAPPLEARAAVAEVATGGVVGRYVVLARVGAGAMGLVYAAYDPDLDRKVALKLLKRRAGADTDAAQTRLQREALALAKLNNPNVVSVHDVGVHAGQVFLAMEFVEGRTLRAWIADAPDGGPWPWREVVKVFAAAGRGLAAAHQQGLIHRDFKPDNVMLGDDGRVRVMDFGLARPSELTSTLDEGERSNTSQRVLVSALTRTGAMVGTPAYMAPEQFEGNADARSDQFSFCVALYQALYGQRPFAGDDLNSLLAAIDARAVTPAPGSASVPAWLRQVVLRGLSARPERRWPSMLALLEALADDPAHRRRRWLSAVAVVGALVSTGAGVAWAVQRQARACAGFDQLLSGVWDAEQRGRVDAALEETGLSYARETSQRVRARLDDYTRRWVLARRDACEASRRGEQSGALLDLRMQCLDERLQHVAATVEVLGAADDQVVLGAVKSVAGLPSLDRCADVTALTAEQPPPEETVAARVSALDERLIEARALLRAGRYSPGLEAAEPVLAEAEAIGYEPLEVRAWLTAGTLQIETAAHEQAEATLERSFDAAVGLGMTAEAADAARLLVYVVGVRLARHAEGRGWAKHARPLARATGSEKTTAQLLGVLGVLATEEGNYEEAGALLERSLAAHERALGPEHPGVATTLGSLVGLAGMQGKYKEARAYVERALEISERVLGPNHPEVGLSLSNLGSLGLVEGDLESARVHLERALTIFEAAYGPDHPNVAAALGNLASVAQTEGRHEDAYALSLRSLSIQEGLVDAEHPSLIPLLTIMGMAARAERRYDEADQHLRRALAIGERARGADHPSLADTLTQLAQVALAQARYEDARPTFERAVASTERGLGPEHVRVSDPLIGLGRALLGLRAAGDALPHLERALTLRRDNAAAAESIAVARFALARALWDAPADAGGDRPRARLLGESARASFEAAGDAARVEELDKWLEEHVE